MSTIVITPHAVEQFVRRHRPELATDDARAELEKLAAAARHTQMNARGGGRIWVAEGVALVVRPNHPQHEWIVVTVLPVTFAEHGRHDELEADDSNGGQSTRRTGP